MGTVKISKCGENHYAGMLLDYAESIATVMGRFMKREDVQISIAVRRRKMMAVMNVMN
ncbi:MAG: hypothetical protein ACI4E5_12690 [Suilimivivens sp.]